ncbi:MAG: heavy metal sensor histidine kinase [Desulfuromonadales bacterium]|nr:heavy metal sensor histidine kinase [Desulfuromonadales bacterium]
MFRRSIRFRLTLWYAFTLAVVLAASGLFWDIYFSRELREHHDTRLYLVAEDIANLYFEDGRGARLPLDNADPERCNSLEEYVRLHNWGELVQILNRDGSVTCASMNLRKYRLPLSKQALLAATNGQPYFEMASSESKIPLRLLTYPVLEKGQIVSLIQVAISLSEVNRAVHHLRLVLLTFSPLVLLGLSFGGWFLAGRALSPILRIAREAGHIDAENLTRRLPEGESNDELGQMVRSFNLMLGRLEESFQKIKQFSGDASHELRTPLTILKGETEVALRWAKSPDEYRNVLESNIEEINRMERILEDLLLLAKSEAGELPLQNAALSLSDLLQELYLQANFLGESRRIKVLLHLDVDGEVRIIGDELRLRQMFLNLIVNGIKYTPEGGRVDIGLGLDDSNVVVSIKDNGIGIDKNHLPHIYDRFYRVDAARNREDGGTGLGLAIVRWVVDAHGGLINVVSKPGAGTIFTVTLPIGGNAAYRQRQEN